MNVLELLKSQPPEALLARYKELYSADKITTAYFARVLEELEAQEDSETDLKAYLEYKKADIFNDRARYEVGGLHADGTVYSVDLTPWSEWKNMEVVTGPGVKLPALDMACHILYELTWMGFPEEQEAKKAQIEASIAGFNAEDFVEVSPGILVSPQVAGQMERSGSLNELLKNLTLEDVVNKGQKVKDSE